MRREILAAYRANYPSRPTSKTGITEKKQQDHVAGVSEGKQEIIVRLQLTKAEASAMNEYAKSCGESLSELIRKALIREATLADGYGADDPQYEYRFKLPADVDPASFSDTRERKQVEDTHNNIRSILGWRKIRL